MVEASPFRGIPRHCREMFGCDFSSNLIVFLGQLFLPSRKHFSVALVRHLSAAPAGTRQITLLHSFGFWSTSLFGISCFLEMKWLRLLSPPVLLHHDNAPAHRAFQGKTFCAHFRAALSKSSRELLPHPPYCPDLATSDVFLFPILKLNTPAGGSITTCKSITLDWLES